MTCTSLLVYGSILAPGVSLAAWSPVLDELADLDRFQARIDAVLEAAVPATVGVRVDGASGSGVLVSADGLVLTAAHVVGAPGRPATVVLHDGTELEAETLGSNTARDSGMLRVKDRSDLPHVAVPAAMRPAPGAWCLTLGHPGGFQAGRPPVPRIGRVQDPGGRFVETDCPVIHGDSGGPLFDLEGNLIGIHSRIEEDVASNYHVPLSTFRLGWGRMLASQEYERGDAKLGARRVEDAQGGARLGVVLDGRPAHAAGLADGDVVHALNGEVVDGADQLVWYLADLTPGASVELEVTRAGEARSVSVTLGGPPGWTPEPERGEDDQ